MVRNSRGFTLIEILIVIAIVAILTSIALGSFSSMSSKTKDSRIIDDLVQVRGLADSVYSTNNTYSVGNLLKSPFTASAGCTKQSGVDDTLYNYGADIKKLNGVTNCLPLNNGELRTYFNATSFAATAKLTDGTFWCVDTFGTSKGGYATRDAALTDTSDTSCN